MMWGIWFCRSSGRWLVGGRTGLTTKNTKDTKKCKGDLAIEFVGWGPVVAERFLGLGLIGVLRRGTARFSALSFLFLLYVVVRCVVVPSWFVVASVCALRGVVIGG
jgi:hypothetical protein